MDSNVEEAVQEEVVLAKPPEPVWFYYTLSFLVFPFGLFIGKVYSKKDGAENKNFGRTSFFLGLALPAILIFIAVIAYALA